MKPFWETKSLAEMTTEEWELLCDGCGKCCLNKLIDDDTEELYYTNVACKLLSAKDCGCMHYQNRFQFVPQCTAITKDNIAELTWLPDSCAYRRIHAGRGLAQWHPLISGDKKLMHRKGISVKGKIVSEIKVRDVEDHIVIWPMLDVE